MSQNRATEEAKSKIGNGRDEKPVSPVVLPFGTEKIVAARSGEVKRPESRKYRFLMIFGALFFGLAGQLLLGEEQEIIGAIFIGLAALLFIIAFQAQPGPAGWLTSETWGRQLLTLNWKGGISLALALLFAALSIWLFGLDIPEYYAWLSYRISIGLLILSTFWLNKVGGVSNTTSPGKKWGVLDLVLLAVILGIALFMRLYRFDQIPYGLWYDEADNGLHALGIFRQAEYLPVFAKSTNLPAHFLYLIAFSFRIFGVSVFAIRIVSVIFGVATVAASFFLGSELFDRRLGLVLAFFLAVSRWDVNWSRIGMHGVSVPFFEILSILLLLWALRKQHLTLYTLAGLSLGLGGCFYTPLLVFPIVLGVFLLFLCFHRRDLLLSTWRGFLFLILGAVIVLSPVLQFAVRQPASFAYRLHVTSIFTGKSTQEGWNAVARTTRDHLLMFNYRGDNNGRHNLPRMPMLDPISGTLMVLGMALSLWRIRQPGSFLFVAWLLIMILPGIFSLDFESPQSLRSIGSLPPAYLLAVVPIYSLWQEWDQLPAKRPILWFVAPLVVVLGLVGYINYHIYFDLQSVRSDVWVVFSTPETIASKVLAGLDDQTDAYFSELYYYSPTVEFLAPNITPKNYHPLKPYDTFAVPVNSEKSAIFFVDSEQYPFFLQAKRYYPDADFKEYKNPDGRTILYQITLSPTDIANAQGVTASYYRDADWDQPPFLVEEIPAVRADWNEDDASAQSPVGVKFNSTLHADEYGFYRLILQSPSVPELYLDNANIPLKMSAKGEWIARIQLAKGFHSLEIRTLEKEGRFSLTWKPPGEDEALIPSSHLFLPPVSNNGLLGHYFANDDWEYFPAFIKVDPWINFTYSIQPLLLPYTIEWVGKIEITEPGVYGFKLSSVNESDLFIDERQVANNTKEADLYLSSGFHSIRLRYATRSGYSYIRLYWKPPASEWEVIPQDVLFLP